MSEFLQLAYRKLGLPMEGHDIGTMRYIDLPRRRAAGSCAVCTWILWMKNCMRIDRATTKRMIYDCEADGKWRETSLNCFLLYPRWF